MDFHNTLEILTEFFFRGNKACVFFEGNFVAYKEGEATFSI